MIQLDNTYYTNKDYKIRSPYYRTFKKNAGRINHDFITANIGISLLDENSEKPSSMHTTWNPKDISASKGQGQLFIRKSGIVFMSSVAEAYIEELYENLIPFSNLTVSADTSKSITKKVVELNEIIGTDVFDFSYDLFYSMIQWRNNLVHRNKKKIDPAIKGSLRSSENDIKIHHSNLDIHEFLSHFDEFQVPTFKEAISLFTATNRIIQNIDSVVYSNVDKVKLALNFFKNWFDVYTETENKKMSKFLSFQQSEKRKQYLEQLLVTEFPILIKNDTQYEELDKLLVDLSRCDIKEFKEKIDISTQ